ncbi:TnsA-like heteromeric transposase endonuclease subunit [Streptomyces sp. NPDC002588]|uniref:TnsA-like heteromeric transposase endonuclease subunit n=1 Tax=Streptomyces sp. NPDC002588 TaxID=3154419 RepID=UPI00332644A5
MEALSRAYGDEALTAFELDFLSNGERRRHPLGASWQVPFEAVEPVRPFRWDKGTPGFAGWYYSATVRDHVGYESWLERDRLILLDRDPQVRAILAQPFWLHWHDGERRRRHAPDYFVRLATGQARIVDVRAEDDMDEGTWEAFVATQRACSAVGWD